MRYKKFVVPTIKTTLIIILLAAIIFIKVDFFSGYNTLATVKRENQLYCKVHDRKLKYGLAVYRYGLILPSSEECFAREENFPNARTKVLGGCIVSPLSPAFAKVLYCSTCRRNEERWCEVKNTNLVKEIEVSKTIVNKKKEDAQLKNEQTVKEEVDIPIITQTKFRYTSKMELSEESVEIMLKQHNLFCSQYGFTRKYCNPYSSGFDNKFEKKNNGQVVYDQANGLMWQQSGSAEDMAYEKAKVYITKLNSDQFAGYNDWRLPTLEETMSLMESTNNESTKKNVYLYIDPIFDKKQRSVWTSDLYSVSLPWVVYFVSGYCGKYHFLDYYVRAVRSAQ